MVRETFWGEEISNHEPMASKVGRKYLTNLQEGVVEVEDIGAHEVLGLDSAQDDDVSPDALVTENTNTAVSIKTSKGLRNLNEKVSEHRFHSVYLSHLVVKTSFLNHADEDVVGLAGNLDSLLGNITEDTDGNTGTGEGVSVHEVLVDAKLATNCSDFILEEKSERLNELKSFPVSFL